MTPDDPEFELFQILSGGRVDHVPRAIAQIPSEVARALGWNSTTVYLTSKDAQKIRHHPMHGMDAHIGMHLPMVIRQGDYYQTTNRGSPLQIEVVLHLPEIPKRAYFLVLARDRDDRGIFLRTYYFTGQLSRNKMRDATVLRKNSDVTFFRGG